MKCISLFKCNPQIEVIDKSHCSLEDVPNFQNYSRSLEELFLDANKLTVLNDNVFKLTKLRRFSFSDNAIQDIPPDIAKLVNLVELDCSRNKIQLIPEQIKFLRGLQVCDFSANNVEYLPSGLVQLKNLTCLTLNYCPIKSLPEDFGQLKSLESLEMRENELESLPASMTSLESLKKLDIGRNLISKLPDDIGRLTKLEYLLVDGNRLETVPSEIGRLKNLQCLDLSQQEYGLKSLPEEISGLVSLTDLHLSENHLQILPDGLRYLKNLNVFKADNNYLTELNPSIGGCVALQELVLTSNQITRLPSSIGELTDLRSLNIDSNLLRDLTPHIGNLRNLGILSLRDNLLTHLPDEIGQLELAKVIDLSGNRLEYLPVSIAALNLKALWLSKNQAQPLPKLQIDELPDTTKILTCYLLPQQDEDNENFEQTNGVQDDAENYDSNRQAAVSFDTAAIDDSELPDDVQFVRHDTPHPRELKARHQKLLNNKTTNLKGHDNASFVMVDNEQSYEPDEEHQRVSNFPPSVQHLDYESNGLPEVPPPTIKSSTTRSYNNNYQYGGDAMNDNNKVGYARDTRYDNGLDNSASTGYHTRDNYRELRSDHAQDAGDSKCHVLDIIVRRYKNHKPGLGLSIAGGKDTPPFKDNDEGIFVSKVTRGGPAESAAVKVGDKILAVNNNIFYEGITHQRAVDIFKKIKPDCAEFSMRVLRDPDDETGDPSRYNQDDHHPVKGDSLVTSNSQLFEKTTNSTFTRTYTIPAKADSNNTQREATNGTTAVNNLRQFLMKEPEGKGKSATLTPGMSLESSSNKNIIYTTLVKDYKHDLGLVLESKNEDNSRTSWSNIIIADIRPDSIASRDGKLDVDDKIISINGTDVTNLDLDRVVSMLEGPERFIRIVVSRGDYDDPIGAALRNMPTRPSLGSWFSSTTNMSHRPSLIESYQRPTFGSVNSLQKQAAQLVGTKPPKPPKPSHLVTTPDGDGDDTNSTTQYDDNPVARPRVRSTGANANNTDAPASQISDAERRAAWRRERLKSIEDDVEMAKMIAEAQRRRREEK